MYKNPEKYVFDDLDAIMEKLLHFSELGGRGIKINGLNMAFDDDDDVDTYDGEDDEEERRSELRHAALGFKPQKEIVYNQLLPYFDDLDSESVMAFSVIKTNLAKTICLREMRPGFVIWTSRLSK